ncbi:hypothetical protein HIM_05503 [Hirsutella minnesotensis 3608]|uniref:Uncharacterized protein n=1 Tax=Hirsutella minnesotensis 3608 TaxID=1043627 RepID=A0A0F8A029_9HYPO|nr:hypothetical protein HIM_05503 [Hirsutella minnesotensis 3608]
MGMHGPLTAQALGRSPYDDVVEGEGEEDPRQPTQQFDYRGRPINTETRRINREIVRSHNEVMLVIGVAEAENPSSSSEAESQRRHEAHEEAIGLSLASPAKRFVEAVGIFGINGMRQRILIYKRYSRMPFWELYQASRRDFSWKRDILSGAPSSFVANYVEVIVRRWHAGEKEHSAAKRLYDLLSPLAKTFEAESNRLYELWTYVRIHMDLHIALQHLGLAPNQLLLPTLSFFIPFTRASPISAPPAPKDLKISSLLYWLGGAFISTTPFIVWAMSQRMLRDWKPQVWTQVFKRLPNTIFNGKKLPPAPTQYATSVTNTPEQLYHHPDADFQQLYARDAAQHTQSPTTQGPETTSAGQSGPSSGTRRPSVFSARGDDYASDEDENEGVSATLISFDVEATESADAPPGLWSAELRPSQAMDARPAANQQPVYLDTLLTQLPALIGSHIFTDAITRILTIPYEATALRLIARTVLLNQGISCDHIHAASLLSGLTWTSVMNICATEFVHLVACGEVWAAFTGIAQWYHRTEEEWKEYEATVKSNDDVQ